MREQEQPSPNEEKSGIWMVQALVAIMVWMLVHDANHPSDQKRYQGIVLGEGETQGANAL